MGLRHGCSHLVDVFKLKIFFSGYFGEPFRAYSTPIVLGKNRGAVHGLSTFSLRGIFRLGGAYWRGVQGKEGKKGLIQPRKQCRGSASSSARQSSMELILRVGT